MVFCDFWHQQKYKLDVPCSTVKKDKDWGGMEKGMDEMVASKWWPI
jgi:hypothetical protein